VSSIEDKNALLSQLKITEEDNQSGTITTFHLFIVSVISAIIAAAIAYFLLSPEIATSQKSETVNSDAQAEKSITRNEEPIDSGLNTAQKESKFQFANSNEVLNASGFITARRIATVSAETMGLINDVMVEEGMQVKKGQVLATLDSSVASVGLRLAKARAEVLGTRIMSTNIDLQEAKRVLNRLKKLDEKNYSSESQITRAQADVDKLLNLLTSSRADIKVALLQAEQQQELLDNHTIRAPFSGIVTVKNAQPGEIVAPSSAGGGFTRTGICTIVDMDSLEIEVDVNEAYIGRVSKDQRVKANLDAYPDWDILASVIAIIPTADRAKATVKVRIKIEQKDGRILPDMGVKVAFLKDNK